MNTNISNIVNRGSVRWILVAVFLVGTIFGATGIAAAQLDGSQNVFYDETTPITDDTTELEVTVNATGGYEVYANYYRIADDSESTETLESENVVLEPSPNSGRTTTITATYEVETNNTAGYRVVVHNTGYDIPDLSEVGNITVTQLPLDGGAVDSGNDSLVGGPVGFGGDSGNGTIIGILAVVALALVVRMKA